MSDPIKRLKKLQAASLKELRVSRKLLVEFHERISQIQSVFPQLLEKLIIVNGATFATSLTLVGYLLNSTADHHLSRQDFQKVEWAWAFMMLSFGLSVLGIMKGQSVRLDDLDLIRARIALQNARVDRIVKTFDAEWRRLVLGYGNNDMDVESVEAVKEQKIRWYQKPLDVLLYVGPLVCTLVAWNLLFIFADHAIPLR